MPYKDIEKRRVHARLAQKRYREKHPERSRRSKYKWELANKHKLKEKALRRKLRDPDWGKRYWYWTKYGITLEERQQMFNSQKGLCKICSNNKAEHVDHNPETGKVRGLLCGSCNRGIGCLQHNIKTLLNAIVYLRENA